MVSAYTEMVGSFFDATSVIATQVDEAALRNGVELVDAASRRSETIAAATRNVVLDTLTGGTSIDRGTGTLGGVAQDNDGPVKRDLDDQFDETDV